MSSEIYSKNLVVTGFGPFGPHKVNDSWECVKKLKEFDIEKELGVSLFTVEIPVLYSASENEVSLLWKKHNPVLIVHVGVHNTENIVIEKCARKMGYTRADVSGNCPSASCCPYGTEDSISTSLDLKKITDSVDCRGIHLSVSNNAGNYLCEYTYYLSLCEDPKRAIFIHIPPAGTSPSIEDKALALKNIIIAVYKQMVNH